MAGLRRALALAASTVALAWSAAASAETLYTWIDASGRVQYSDQPPKNFTGPVRRLEIDDKATPASPAPKAQVPAEKAQPPAAPVVPDVSTGRRAMRERLQHDLDVAREKLAAAQKALAENEDPASDERQTVQRLAASATPRMTCNTVVKDGKKITICPVSVPTEAYYSRMEKLRDEVRRAEDEVGAAERAYRRGTD